MKISFLLFSISSLHNEWWSSGPSACRTGALLSFLTSYLKYLRWALNFPFLKQRALIWFLLSLFEFLEFIYLRHQKLFFHLSISFPFGFVKISFGWKAINKIRWILGLSWSCCFRNWRFLEFLDCTFEYYLFTSIAKSFGGKFDFLAELVEQNSTN